MPRVRVADPWRGLHRVREILCVFLACAVWGRPFLAVEWSAELAGRHGCFVCVYFVVDSVLLGGIAWRAGSTVCVCLVFSNTDQSSQRTPRDLSTDPELHRSFSDWPGRNLGWQFIPTSAGSRRSPRIPNRCLGRSKKVVVPSSPPDEGGPMGQCGRGGRGLVEFKMPFRNWLRKPTDLEVRDFGFRRCCNESVHVVVSSACLFLTT